VLSVRGEKISTSGEISYETGTAGLRIPPGPITPERTIGGESPHADTAPGFRPKELGDDSTGDGTTDA
jgi:hypothetical protein